MTSLFPDTSIDRQVLLVPLLCCKYMLYFDKDTFLHHPLYSEAAMYCPLHPSAIYIGYHNQRNTFFPRTSQYRPCQKPLLPFPCHDYMPSCHKYSQLLLTNLHLTLYHRSIQTQKYNIPIFRASICNISIYTSIVFTFCTCINSICLFVYTY